MALNESECIPNIGIMNCATALHMKLSKMLLYNNNKPKLIIYACILWFMTLYTFKGFCNPIAKVGSSILGSTNGFENIKKQSAS